MPNRRLSIPVRAPGGWYSHDIDSRNGSVGLDGLDTQLSPCCEEIISILKKEPRKSDGLE